MNTLTLPSGHVAIILSPDGTAKVYCDLPTRQGDLTKAAQALTDIFHDQGAVRLADQFNAHVVEVPLS